MGDLGASRIVAPALAIAAGGGGGTVVTNYVPNPSFETNTTGYSSGFDVTYSQSATGAQVGTQSLNMLIPSGAATGTREYGIAVGTPPSSVGEDWTLSFYVSGSPTAGRTVSAYLNGTLGTSVNLSGTPQRVSVTVNLSNGTTPIGRAHFTSVAVGDNYYVDAIMLERASSASTYFDGDTAAGGGFTYAWTGTAHASTSTRTG